MTDGVFYPLVLFPCNASLNPQVSTALKTITRQDNDLPSTPTWTFHTRNACILPPVHGECTHSPPCPSQATIAHAAPLKTNSSSRIITLDDAAASQHPNWKASTASLMVTVSQSPLLCWRATHPGIHIQAADGWISGMRARKKKINSFSTDIHDLASGASSISHGQHESYIRTRVFTRITEKGFGVDSDAGSLSRRCGTEMHITHQV